MGSMSSVARIKGDAFTLLKEEHRQIKDLLEEFVSAPDVVSKQQICDQVLSRLMIHAKVEEEVFYPAVRKALNNDEGHELVDEAQGQHYAVHKMIDELHTMPPSHRGYEAKFHVLAEAVIQHIAEEEHDIFPRALEAAADWDHVAAQMQIARVALQGRVGGHSAMGRELSRRETRRRVAAPPLWERHGK